MMLILQVKVSFRVKQAINYYTLGPGYIMVDKLVLSGALVCSVFSVSFSLLTLFQLFLFRFSHFADMGCILKIK